MKKLQKAITAALIAAIDYAFALGKKVDHSQKNERVDVEAKKAADAQLRKARYIHEKKRILEIDIVTFKKKHPGKFSTALDFINMEGELEKLNDGLCVEIPHSYV